MTLDPDTEPEAADAARPGFLARHRRALVVVVVVVALAVVSVAGYALWTKHRLDEALASVGTVAVFEGIDPATRPPAPADGGTTFLLAGSDLLAPTATTGLEAVSASPTSATPTSSSRYGRADVIMLLHVDAARTKASIVSLPRDALVGIPAYTDADGQEHAAQRRKVNSAFSLGGPTLLVRTVEGLTGIRVDHFAYVDYDGLIRLVDAVGGVTVDNLYATSDVYGNPEWDFPAGPLTLDGFHARVWVSQRKNLPHSDLDRARNSRELLRAIGVKLASPSVLSNPVRLQEVLDLLRTVATVDDTLDPGAMKSLALSARGLDVDSIPMRTAPVTGRSTYQGEVVFDLDTSKTPCLWAAIASSDLAGVTRCSQP